MTRQTWPSAVSNAVGLLTVLAVIATMLAWTIVLPTVGLLYFVGALA